MRVDLALFVASVVFFIVWPNVDLSLAALFYDPSTKSFPGANNGILEVPYRIFAYIHIPYLLILITGSVWFHIQFRANKNEQSKSLRKKFLYLLCCLLVGPGILVNAVLKDNSIGRARPRDVVQFDGAHQYTGAFRYSGACQRNCSFTSGHAAIGFFALALGWVFASRLWLASGILLGALLGLMRMAQGAHFFSDVLFLFGWCIGRAWYSPAYFRCH